MKGFIENHTGKSCSGTLVFESPIFGRREIPLQISEQGTAFEEVLKLGELGSFGYVSIILTIVLAFCFLGEKVTLPFLLCLALILLGTAMMLKIPLPGRKKPEGKEK